MTSKEPRHSAEICATLVRARQRLLDLRGQHGHWEGELSSSALSTATAVCALEAYRRAAKIGPSVQLQLDSLVARGRDWLAENQNADGGWGDTTVSFSNISTTSLGWGAMGSNRSRHRPIVKSAERWLEAEAGGLNPTILAKAIRRRYGKDHTFSVPILTTLALTGRLGTGRDAWRHVPQLPFELAACPHRWFAWLRLPVVSYALPALIAIGLVRHHHRPTRNPLTRLLRRVVRGRTLHVLQSIQPTTGGFLEATPLTSFVVLSLTGADLAHHSVVQKGIDFLLRSARTDGSWSIDTNLATWVTTLSVNALDRAGGLTGRACAGPAEQSRSGGVSAEPGGNGRETRRDRPVSQGELDTGALEKLRDWLIGQQYRVEHPYTHARPGGWAWTDLAGGVPDADDTPGALLALKALDDGSRRVRQAAEAGIRWLLELQNKDGGMPTFCRGWGALPFDRSSPDLTAHALRAWLTWRQEMSAELQVEMTKAEKRAVHYLRRTQQNDGAWVPLWFGNQYAPSDMNLTYGTSRVLLAVASLSAVGESSVPSRLDPARAVGWLLRSQNKDGGWGGASGTPSSVEESALAVESLSAILGSVGPARTAMPGCDPESIAGAVRRGVAWLLEHTEDGRHFPPAPIGFYFAKLWYFERFYPLIFAVAALGQASAVRPGLFPGERMLAGADP